MSEIDWLKTKQTCDGILHLELNRMPVNAFNAQALNELGDLFALWEENEQIKAVVMSSALKVFSAGLNLKEAQHYDIFEQTAIVNGFHACFLRIFSFCKPLVVAVEGAAIAGGLFPILCSDYRVSGPAASFGLAEVKVGVGLPIGLVEIVRSMMSADTMRLMMQTGIPIKADRALQMQIIDECVSAGRATERAFEVAKNLAALPSTAYATVKHQIRAPVIAVLEGEVARIGHSEATNWFTDETPIAMAKMIK